MTQITPGSNFRDMVFQSVCVLAAELHRTELSCLAGMFKILKSVSINNAIFSTICSFSHVFSFPSSHYLLSYLFFCFRTWIDVMILINQLISFLLCNVVSNVPKTVKENLLPSGNVDGSSIFRSLCETLIHFSQLLVMTDYKQMQNKRSKQKQWHYTVI